MADEDALVLEEAIKLIGDSENGLTFNSLFNTIKNTSKTYTVVHMRACDLTRILKTGIDEDRIELNGDNYQVIEPSRKKAKVVIETPSPSPNEPVDRSTLDIGPGVSSEIETNEGEMVTQMPVVQTSDNRIVEEVVIETPSPSPNEPVDRSTLDIGPGVSSEIETNEGEMVTQMPVVQTSDNRIVEEVVIETPSPSPNEPVDRSTLDIGPGVSSEIETNEGEMVTQMPVVQTSDNRIVEEVVIETPSPSPNEPVDRSTLDIGPGVSSEIETNEGEMVTQMPVVQTSDNRIVEEVVIETPSPSPNEPVDRSTLDIGPGVSSEIETNEGEMVTQMPVVQTSDNRIVEEVIIETPSPSPNEPVDRSTLDIGPGVSSEIETNEGEMVTQMPVVQTSDNRIVEEVVIETPSPSPNEPVDRSTLDIGPGVSSEIETNEGEMVTQMPVVQTSDNRIVEEDE